MKRLASDVLAALGSQDKLATYMSGADGNRPKQQQRS